mmetsp:Transcript_100641/g.280289  ORF Transcript_100641/g.280289 Transcript_100641/m.280289 type:complete len:351 (-) Transcript_100641:24-1076(-)
MRAPGHGLWPDLEHALLLPAVLSVLRGDLDKELGGNEGEGTVTQVDPQRWQLGLRDGAVAPYNLARHANCAAEVAGRVLWQQRAHDAGVVLPGHQECLLGAGVDEEAHRRRLGLPDCDTAGGHPEAAPLSLQRLRLGPDKRVRLVGARRHLAHMHGNLPLGNWDQREESPLALFLETRVQWLPPCAFQRRPTKATYAIPRTMRWEGLLLHNDERLVLDLSLSELHGVLDIVTSDPPTGIRDRHHPGLRVQEGRGLVGTEEVLVAAALAALRWDPEVCIARVQQALEMLQRRAQGDAGNEGVLPGDLCACAACAAKRHQQRCEGAPRPAGNNRCEGHEGGRNGTTGPEKSA